MKMLVFCDNLDNEDNMERKTLNTNQQPLKQQNGEGEVMASVNNQEATELFEGQTLLYEQINGYLKTMCLKWAVQLGVPDIIHNHNHNHTKPITLPELVSTLQIPPSKSDFVKRLMRFLAHNGIFHIHESQQDHELAYALTPASKLLVTGTAHSDAVLLKVAFALIPALVPIGFVFVLWDGLWVYALLDFTVMMM
ncbi:hypothetical protein VNO78_20203 [Psophocarpus tetragonolobus]|uniref:O-methyltransferase dimerisation domain-containing protein n=1 Tax=Psophocarpus tetragonolobus TaxID=3891 RepID=A0AAN9SE58_PSOTE